MNTEDMQHQASLDAQAIITTLQKKYKYNLAEMYKAALEEEIKLKAKAKTPEQELKFLTYSEVVKGINDRIIVQYMLGAGFVPSFDYLKPWKKNTDKQEGDL